MHAEPLHLEDVLEHIGDTIDADQAAALISSHTGYHIAGRTVARWATFTANQD